MRTLNANEIAFVAEAIEPESCALVFAAAYTGCKFGELAGLRTRNVDFRRRQLTVTETLSEAGGQLALTTLPTSRVRQIPLPRFLMDELRKHFALWPPGHDEFVFTAPDGGPLRRTNFQNRVWLPAVDLSVGQPLSFQDLRHSYAAMLIAQGEHPRVVQIRLGHTSVWDTLNAYGHLIASGAGDGRLDADYLSAFGGYLASRASRYSPNDRQDPAWLGS